MRQKDDTLPAHDRGAVLLEAKNQQDDLSVGSGKPSGYLPEAEKERQGAACWAGEARPHPDMFLDTQVKIRQYSLPVILLIRKNNAQEWLGD